MFYRIIFLFFSLLLLYINTTHNITHHLNWICFSSRLNVRLVTMQFGIRFSQKLNLKRTNKLFFYQYAYLLDISLCYHGIARPSKIKFCNQLMALLLILLLLRFSIFFSFTQQQYPVKFQYVSLYIRCLQGQNLGYFGTITINLNKEAKFEKKKNHAKFQLAITERTLYNGRIYRFSSECLETL